MFRRMVTRLDLAAFVGLGLLLVGGPAKADQQGWPVAGNWSNSSRSSSIGSYSPSYSPTYQTWIPQLGGYYGSGSPANSYQRSTVEGYYGASGSDPYYGISTAESPRKRPVRVNLRVPSDAKIWFDGNPTNQTGMIRSFESSPVAVGPQYVYQIRIQWKEDGKDVTQTRQINVHADEVVNLRLGSPRVAALTR